MQAAWFFCHTAAPFPVNLAMPDATEPFLAYCLSVLQGDPFVIDELRFAGFDCSPAAWSFTLPALHAFLTEHLHVTLAYKAFIQQLFASDINLRLREHGAEIAIADNQGKVNSSRYCLRRLPL